jgi:predicted ATPase with chaperone activity
LSTLGLPDSTVRESRDRVRAAIHNAGLEFTTAVMNMFATSTPTRQATQREQARASTYATGNPRMRQITAVRADNERPAEGREVEGIGEQARLV